MSLLLRNRGSDPNLSLNGMLVAAGGSLFPQILSQQKNNTEKGSTIIKQKKKKQIIIVIE